MSLFLLINYLSMPQYSTITFIFSKLKISNVSLNQSILIKSIPIYKEAFKKSGFNQHAVNTPAKKKTGRNKIRERKIIRFDSPYCMNVKTNHGKKRNNFAQIIIVTRYSAGTLLRLVTVS